jgi:hypothetical protein
MLRRCEMWILYKIGQLLVVFAVLAGFFILVIRGLLRELNNQKRPRPP